MELERIVVFVWWQTNDEMDNEPEHISTSLDLLSELFLQPTPSVPVACGLILLLSLFLFVYNSVTC